MTTASSVEIQPVTTSKQQKQFIQFAWDLYRDNEYWIPPLRQNLKETLGYKKHPFYLIAESQTFLAFKDGKVVGRIAAIHNRKHNEHFKEKRGFFGFFESINDPEVAKGLFDAATAWLKERGMTDVRGPMNPSLNYETGTLVEGFDDPPTFMMTYNLPYYDELIRGYGFEKTQDLYAFFGHVGMLEEIDQRKFKFLMDEVEKRMKVKFRPMNKKKFMEEVRLFLEIFNRSMANHWSFVPLTEAEMEHMAHGMKHLVVPEVSWFAEVDGKAIGCVFGIPDYNPRIKKIDGRLFPLGFFRLLWNKHKIKRTRLISTTVVPEYQRWGVGAVILAHMLPTGLEYGMSEVEFSWVAESNDLSYKTLKNGGAKLTKTYRVYDLRISG